MKTRIRSRYIVGYDNDKRDHVVHLDAGLVYEGDEVVFVGSGYGGAVDRELDFGNSLVMPGFVDLNAAVDFEDSDLFLDARGDGSHALGRQWSEAYYRNGPRDLSDPEEEGRKYLYGLCRLALCGTTTILPVTGLLHRAWAESRAEFERLAAIVSRLGLRAYLGPSFRDGVNIVTAGGERETRWDEEAGMRGLADNVGFIGSLGSDPLIRGALVPSTIETCSEMLLRDTAAWAERLDVPVRLHATQSAWEFAEIGKRFGKTPIRHLADLGLLDRRLLLPHALYFTGHPGPCGEGDDIDLLAASGATVLHCPQVISRHGGALESFRRFLDRGIRVAVATDCCPPDMILNMRTALLAARVVDRDGLAATAADVFRAATLAGADALGRPDLGRLAPGTKADMAVVDLGGFHVNAVDDPIRALVLSAGGRDVTDVFVGGRDVVRNRAIAGIDFGELRRWGDGYFQKLKRSYRERDYLGRPTETFFEPAFPMRPNASPAVAGE